tara:strand:+ start:184 stop:321 length:138 start_codon:yes stop_codon:yes gene_type:complete
VERFGDALLVLVFLLVVDFLVVVFFFAGAFLADFFVFELEILSFA